jgi:hypothetical protein
LRTSRYGRVLEKECNAIASGVMTDINAREKSFFANVRIGT